MHDGSDKADEWIAMPDSAGGTGLSRRTFLAGTVAAAVASRGTLQTTARAIEAQWIWDRHAGAVNTWMCFRHTWNLTHTRPVKALGQLRLIQNRQNRKT